MERQRSYVRVVCIELLERLRPDADAVSVREVRSRDAGFLALAFPPNLPLRLRELGKERMGKRGKPRRGIAKRE